MKQAKSIIGHITNNPLYGNLQKARSYKKLISFFPVAIKDGINFMYNKNNTLYIAFKHQGYWMEFNNYQRKYQMEYKQNYIKNTLKRLILLDDSCSCIWADNIKSFYLDFEDRNEVDSDTLPYFEEKSKGEFKNNTKNEKLHKLFEDIRGLICSKKQ